MKFDEKIKITKMNIEVKYFEFLIFIGKDNYIF